MVNDGEIIVLGIVFSILITAIYAIKRNFDENAYYVQNGYHLVSGTNPA